MSQRRSSRIAQDPGASRRGEEKGGLQEDWSRTKGDASASKTAAAGKRARKYGAVADPHGGNESQQEEVPTPAKKAPALRKPKAGTRKRAHDDAMAIKTQEEDASKEAIKGMPQGGEEATATAASAAAAAVQPQPQKRPKPRATKASMRAEVLEALHTEGELASEFHLYEAYPHTREFDTFRARPQALIPSTSAHQSVQPLLPQPGLPNWQQRLQQAAQPAPLLQPRMSADRSPSHWASMHLQARLQAGPHSSVLTYSACDIQSTQQSFLQLSVSEQQASIPQQQQHQQQLQGPLQQQQQQAFTAPAVEELRAQTEANTPAAGDMEVDYEEMASVYPSPAALQQLEVQAHGAAPAPEAVARALENVPPAQQPRSMAAGLPEVEEEDAAFNAPLRAVPWPAVVPNLGYACLCETLRSYDVYCSRNCVKATFESKGLPAVSALALANARDLLLLIRWNARHGIQFFRLSSGIFPWMSEYKADELPDFPAIREALFAAGEAARALGQRLTFHPSEFCKIAGAEDRDDWTSQSVRELESHSNVFDLMGYEPSAWNKINIHVGGVYGDKDAALQRFAKVVNERLSKNCKARLTVENDDRAALYSVRDLLKLHDLCGIPITFDFHHHKFCTGGMSEQEAFLAALATWPPGVRPVCHWSEARDDRKPTSHSTYVLGPISLHGKEQEVDVMIESKGKELSLLRYREMACRAAAAQTAHRA